MGNSLDLIAILQSGAQADGSRSFTLYVPLVGAIRKLLILGIGGMAGHVDEGWLEFDKLINHLIDFLGAATARRRNDLETDQRTGGFFEILDNFHVTIWLGAPGLFGFLGFRGTGTDAKGYVQAATIYQSRCQGHQADEAPPAAKGNTGQDDNDTGSDANVAIQFTYIFLHFIFSSYGYSRFSGFCTHILVNKLP